MAHLMPARVETFGKRGERKYQQSYIFHTFPSLYQNSWLGQMLPKKWSRVLRVPTDPARAQEETNGLRVAGYYSQPTSTLPLLNSQIEADKDGSGVKFISPSDTLPEATAGRVNWVNFSLI